MRFEIKGLKCDHCEYRDDSVPFSEYKESIGKRCPHCGEKLLTEQEYENCLKMYKVAAIAEKIGNVVKWINPFHYYRLIFGDNRKYHTITKDYPKRKINKR